MAISQYLTYQLFNTLFFLWFTAENFFVFTLSLGLRDPTSVDPDPYPRYGFGVGRRTLLTPAPWAFAILFLVHVLFAGTTVFVQWTERGKEIVIRGLKCDHVLVVIFAVSTFAAFAPNAIDSGVGTQILAIWILTLLAGTAHSHAFFTPGGNVFGNVAITWGIFAIFANQVVDSVKWAALALGIISVFAVARSVYVLSEDIRAGIGGGAIRLPAEDAETPSNA
ncbi:hypothetical protein FRC07_000663 [Ceratobasidium sp. 392]|nr:hypothetical protein FRC07_000663 [Ceratobasidium sp. 392]